MHRPDFLFRDYLMREEGTINPSTIFQSYSQRNNVYLHQVQLPVEWVRYSGYLRAVIVAVACDSDASNARILFRDARRNVMLHLLDYVDFQLWRGLLLPFLIYRVPTSYDPDQPADVLLEIYESFGSDHHIWEIAMDLLFKDVSYLISGHKERPHCRTTSEIQHRTLLYILAHIHDKAWYNKRIRCNMSTCPKLTVNIHGLLTRKESILKSVVCHDLQRMPCCGSLVCGITKFFEKHDRCHICNSWITWSGVVQTSRGSQGYKEHEDPNTTRLRNFVRLANAIPFDIELPPLQIYCMAHDDGTTPPRTLTEFYSKCLGPLNNYYAIEIPDNFNWPVEDVVLDNHH